jgi:hypothetical protein
VFWRTVEEILTSRWPVTKLLAPNSFCGLLYDAFSDTDYTATNRRMKDGRKIGKYFEGNGRGSDICLRKWEALRYSVRVHGVLAVMRTKNLISTSLQRYRWTNLPGVPSDEEGILNISLTSRDRFTLLWGTILRPKFPLLLPSVSSTTHSPICDHNIYVH